jgi:hypothetical protein
MSVCLRPGPGTLTACRLCATRRAVAGGRWRHLPPVEMRLLQAATAADRCSPGSLITDFFFPIRLPPPCASPPRARPPPPPHAASRPPPPPRSRAASSTASSAPPPRGLPRHRLCCGAASSSTIWRYACYQRPVPPPSTSVSSLSSLGRGIYPDYLARAPVKLLVATLNWMAAARVRLNRLSRIEWRA